MKNALHEVSAQAAFEDDLDALLSLQSLEADTDQGLVQMMSSSSCNAYSCYGS